MPIASRAQSRGNLIGKNVGPCGIQVGFVAEIGVVHMRNGREEMQVGEVLRQAPRCNFLMRIVILAATQGAVYLATQKGALIVFALVALVLCLPRLAWYKMLNVLCLVFAVLVILLPLETQGLLVSTNGGIFSLASLGMRILLTWPEALQWIANNEVFRSALTSVALAGRSGCLRRMT